MSIPEEPVLQAKNLKEQFAKKAELALARIRIGLYNKVVSEASAAADLGKYAVNVTLDKEEEAVEVAVRKKLRNECGFAVTFVHSGTSFFTVRWD